MSKELTMPVAFPLAGGGVRTPDEQMKTQTRKLMEDSVKLSELAHKLFWLSVVLGIFPLFRYVTMVFEFYNS